MLTSMQTHEGNKGMSPVIIQKTMPGGTKPLGQILVHHCARNGKVTNVVRAEQARRATHRSVLSSRKGSDGGSNSSSQRQLPMQILRSNSVMHSRYHFSFVFQFLQVILTSYQPRLRT